MKAVLDVLGTRGLVALRPAKLLQNFVSALLTHIYYMKSREEGRCRWAVRRAGLGLGLGLVYKLNLNVDDENHHFIDVIPQ